MKNDTPIALPKERFAAWNRFWFSPADPTLLGLIRIACGLITFYTMFVYSFRLQEFMGADAWYDLETRMQDVRLAVRAVDGNLNWPQSRLLTDPKTPDEFNHAKAYFDRFKEYPPLPAPQDKKEHDYIMAYRAQHRMDLRKAGLTPPRTAEERKYLEQYTEKWKGPPPAYPRFDDDGEESAYIDEYIERHGIDPRLVYATQSPYWSLWFDVTDPTAMAFIHGLVVLVTFLFTIGFCTRITSVLTWIACLWYIHRNTAVLFGVDTMQTILLLYLMIGPSGAALSVDRLMARWWSKNKPGIINRWRSWWGKPALAPEQIAPAAYSPTPVPSVSANVTYRLIQIHVCIVYLVAGLAKLQGQSWWNGVAVGYTLTNYEFAPMQVDFYMFVLRQFLAVYWVWALFLVVSTVFTLAFEITYSFLVWRERTRWLILGAAIILHGFIGLFMGLKTFSLMMLVMNMAFLKDKEVHWILDKLGAKPKADAATEKPTPQADGPAPAAALEGATTGVASTAIKNVAAKGKRK
jgi:hypothetical protein